MGMGTIFIDPAWSISDKDNMRKAKTRTFPVTFIKKYFVVVNIV
jgi:hypothetical protein